MKNIRDFIKNPRNIFLVTIALLIVVVGIFYLLNLDSTQEEAETRTITPEEVMIENANSYTEAVKNSDLSACEEIEDENMKATCIRITQGKIDFTRQNQSLPTTSTEDNLE